MKKIKTYKGFVIALDKMGDHFIFLADEYALGEGYRQPEFECGTNIQHCYDFIDSY